MTPRRTFMGSARSSATRSISGRPRTPLPTGHRAANPFCKLPRHSALSPAALPLPLLFAEDVEVELPGRRCSFAQKPSSGIVPLAAQAGQTRTEPWARSVRAMVLCLVVSLHDVNHFFAADEDGAVGAQRPRYDAMLHGEPARLWLSCLRFVLFPDTL